MGREKGFMAQMSRRLEFGISPYEQKLLPAKELFSPIPNTLRRIRRSAWLVIPFYGFFYITSWLDKTHEMTKKRKQPGEFDNDV